MPLTTSNQPSGADGGVDQIKAVLAKHIKPWEMDGFPCVTGIPEAAAEIAALASTARAGAGDWVTVREEIAGLIYAALVHDLGYASKEDAEEQWARRSEDGGLYGHEADLALSLSDAILGRLSAVPASPISTGAEAGVKATALNLADTIRSMVGRSIDEDGRMCDAQDPLDDLCDAIVDQVLQTFAALSVSRPLTRLEKQLRSRLEEEAWSQASVVSCYWIQSRPDRDLVEVVNRDLRLLYEATHEVASPPAPGVEIRELSEGARRVVRAAVDLLDGTEGGAPSDGADGAHTPIVDPAQWRALSEAVTQLEATIPEGEHPARAGHAVTLLISALSQADASRSEQAVGIGETIEAAFREGWRACIPDDADTDDPEAVAFLADLEQEAWDVSQAKALSPQQGPETGGQGAGRAGEGRDLERVRHVKRGTEYEVLGEAEAQVSEGMKRYGMAGATRLISDDDKLTVYRCLKTSKLWCRFTDEFCDGRFVPSLTDAKTGEV